MNWQLRFIIWFCGLWALGIVLSQIAWGAEISVTSIEVERNEQAPIEVRVDDPIGIAASAFTITFDSTNLELVSIQDLFFDMMVYNTEVENGVAVAAGKPVGETDPTKTGLFSLVFALKDKNNTVTYPVKIVPTLISDEGNGWPPEGALVDPLVGTAFDVPIDEAFPVLLSAEETDKLGQGSVTFKSPPPPYGQQSFSVDIDTQQGEWIDVLYVPPGTMATITDIFYVTRQAVTASDYGGVFLKWKGETDFFAMLWFFYKQGKTHESMSLYVNEGQTLQAWVYEKSYAAKSVSKLTFSVEWE